MNILPYLIFFMFFSSAFGCDRCVRQGRAAYFQDSGALSNGACGYRSLALDFNGGYVASGGSSIYRNGVGCGACYQIRCKNTSMCTTKGTKVVLTDLNNSYETDLVLSNNAFVEMAQPGMGQQVTKLGIVDVEYKRIPCVYKKPKLSIRVEELSRKPDYLAIKLLYQGGQTDIIGFDLSPAGSTNEWRPLTRNYGAVWDSSNAGNVPGGALQFRIFVTRGYDKQKTYATKVLPADWMIGAIYDLGVKIDEIAQESCSPCDVGDWN